MDLKKQILQQKKKRKVKKHESPLAPLSFLIMKTKKAIILIGILILGSNLFAQINGYARVTAVDVNKKVLTVANVNQVHGNFEIGKKVIVYHTQGKVVANLWNNSNYGQIGTIGNTGRIEIAIVKNITYTFGVPSSIELTQSLSYAPEINANSSIQLITYPEFTNYSTSSNISALPWDGKVGGVVAFRVIGNLTLNNNITADGAGFRGGAKSDNIQGDCNNYTFQSSDAKFSGKGEGIYKVSDGIHKYAMGHLANGGGGGNPHNAGGGGGGNYSAGGSGGIGWECGVNAGGLGGTGLENEITRDVVIAFFGGGGGGGQQNGHFASDGSNGGGLIIIEADSIIVNSGNVKISANGLNAPNTTGQDGAGAGGAGGSLIIKTKGVKINTAKLASLLLSASGGNGGSVIHRDSHGAGGGGGTGLIKYINTDLTKVAGVSISNNPGTAGMDDNNLFPRITAQNGVNKSGLIFYPGNISLPIELVDQKVICTEKGALISWTTATEVNNDYFQIEKSEDAKAWEILDILKGAGNSNSLARYEFLDNQFSENTAYYRIKQVDYDGKYEYSPILSIFCNESVNAFEFTGYKISDNRLDVSLKTDDPGIIKISLCDISGKKITSYTVNHPDKGVNFIQQEVHVINGVYILIVEQNNTRISKKLIVCN